MSQLSLWYHNDDLSVHYHQYFMAFCLVFLRQKRNTFDSIKDIAPYFLLAATLTASAYYITLGIRNLYLSLLIKIVLVVSLYALILWKLQSVIFRECIEFIRKKI